MTSPEPRMRTMLLVLVIVLAAAALRAPFLAVAPVARTIGEDLGASAAVVGLLTSIPVLCFAVFSPAAVALVRRGGTDFALAVTLAGATVGCLVRVAGGVPLALAGTAIMGMFLAVGNVVIPVIVGREFRAHRVHLMTGVYAAALNGGTMLATLLTAPLAGAVGWRWAITAWAGFAVAALACWLALRGLRAAFVPRPARMPVGTVAAGSAWRHTPTVLLACAFAGQGFAFYATTAWLPTLLADQGYSGTAAGAIASIFQVAGIAGSLLLPVVTIRRSATAGILAVAVAWLAVPFGFLLAPSGWLLWCAMGGLAQGGGITVLFILINALADDERTKAARSGIVQGVGYAVASAGPIVLGALHESTAAWTWPLLCVMGAVVVFGVCALCAVRALRVRGGAAAG